MMCVWQSHAFFGTAKLTGVIGRAGLAKRVPADSAIRSRRVSMSFSLMQVLLEPFHGALHHIAFVFRAAEHVSFTGVDHQLSGGPLRFERVPEFVGLRSGTL